MFTRWPGKPPGYEFALCITVFQQFSKGFRALMLQALYYGIGSAGSQGRPSLLRGCKGILVNVSLKRDVHEDRGGPDQEAATVGAPLKPRHCDSCIYPTCHLNRIKSLLTTRFTLSISVCEETLARKIYVLMHYYAAALETMDEFFATITHMQTKRYTNFRLYYTKEIL
jgi:hypothetical protein